MQFLDLPLAALCVARSFHLYFIFYTSEGSNDKFSLLRHAGPPKTAPLAKSAVLTPADFRPDKPAPAIHFHGSTTLQPIRSNGAVSRVTIRWPRERTMAAMSESRSGSGPFARAVNSPQIAAARASKFNTRYFRPSSDANFLMRS